MPSLRKAYRRLNREYFHNRLPDDIILKWARMKDMGDYECDGHTITIRINRILGRWKVAWIATLLHEMAHLATADEAADHGPRWLRERRRLYRAGAFESLL